MKRSTVLLGALGAGVVAIVASRRSCDPAPGRPPGPPGPLPRRRGAGRACRVARPETIGEDQLWVPQDCSTWDVGPGWDAVALYPALQDWADRGWRDRDRFDHHTVVRETLRPYVACIDAWPWADLWSDADRPTPDAWGERWRAADADHPEIANLIQVVFQAYGNILSGLIQAERLFSVDHPDGRSFRFFRSEMGPTLELAAFEGVALDDLDALRVGQSIRNEGFVITRIA